MNSIVYRIKAMACLCLVVPLLSSCGGSPSYRSFTGRNQSYYAQLVGACDKVMAQLPNGTTEERKIPGNDESLPLVVRDLHPAYVLVKTNAMFIKIGEGRGSYGITWYLSDAQRSLWQMETYAEGRRQVVFSSLRPPPKSYFPGK